MTTVDASFLADYAWTADGTMWGVGVLAATAPHLLLSEPEARSAEDHAEPKSKLLISYVQTAHQPNLQHRRPSSLQDWIVAFADSAPASDLHVWIDELGSASSPHADWWIRAAPLLYAQMPVLAFPALSCDYTGIRMVSHMSFNMRALDTAVAELQSALEQTSVAAALPDHIRAVVTAPVARGCTVSLGWLQRPWPLMEFLLGTIGAGYCMTPAGVVRLAATVVLVRLLTGPPAPPGAAPRSSPVSAMRASLGEALKTAVDEGSLVRGSMMQWFELPDLAAEQSISQLQSEVFALAACRVFDVGETGEAVSEAERAREVALAFLEGPPKLQNGTYRVADSKQPDEFKLRLSLASAIQGIETLSADPGQMYDPVNIVDWKLSLRMLLSGRLTMSAPLPGRDEMIADVLGSPFQLWSGYSTVPGGRTGAWNVQHSTSSCAAGALTVKRMEKIWGRLREELAECDDVRARLNQAAVSSARVGEWARVEPSVLRQNQAPGSVRSTRCLRCVAPEPGRRQPCLEWRLADPVSGLRDETTPYPFLQEPALLWGLVPSGRGANGFHLYATWHQGGAEEEVAWQGCVECDEQHETWFVGGTDDYGTFEVAAYDVSRGGFGREDIVSIDGSRET